MAGGKKNKAQNTGGLPQPIVNKKARHDYEILEKYEAGISLTGSEVKAIRAGNVQLKESYVKIVNSECFLVNCHIPPYRFTADAAYVPTRERKLLLHRREILRLNQSIMQKGLTVIPLRLYFTERGRCKIEIGVGRGKKLHDKRESLKEREVARTLQRFRP